ncbi:MAG: leucine-rich repeat protein [Thermoguttaceae bacterium]|nr:leucine-rich repeat protein [Thermoguttaceae bacterium]
MELNTKRYRVLKSIMLTAFGVAIAISWAFWGNITSCVAQSIISEDGRYQLSADGKKFGLYLEHDSALAEFVVPDGVETIMPGAFREVRKLKRIVLPASVVEIGKDAFVCPDLDAIDVAEENPVFRSINGVLFSKDGKTLVRLPMGRQTDCYYVPKGVETIEAGALQYCFFLKTVVIPNGVKTIGDNAISGGFLATISLPTSVEHIGDGAFENYTHVKSVYVAEDNPFFRSIDGVLYSKDGKTLLFYPRGKEGSEREAPEIAERSKEDVQFSDDGKTLIKYPETKSDEVYYVPDGVETIASEAFMNCASIRSIVIPEGVTAIGDKAFYRCRKLETIALPSSLKSLGEQAIYENDSLTGIYVDDNPVFSSIGGVLCSKDGKTLIKCPEALPSSHYSVLKGVERIEKRAFANCRRLEELMLSEETKEIAPEAFVGCANLRSIGPPNNNPFFRYDAVLFSKDQTILVKCPPGFEKEKYAVPESVKEIADGAFLECSQLQTIELPKSLERIGARAFSSCSRLKTLTIPENVAFIADDAFDPTLVVRPYEGSYAEHYAEEKKLNFNSITENEKAAATFKLRDDGKTLGEYIGQGEKARIPDGVEVVYGGAFVGRDARSSSGIFHPGVAEALKTIVIPESVREIKGGFAGCASLEAFEVSENNPNFRAIDGVIFSKDGKTLVAVPAKRVQGAYAVPEGVEVIGPYAFSELKSLTSIVIPESVKEIGDGAFYGCYQLSALDIPKNVEKIGAGAFFNCSSLSSIDLPPGVEEIAANTFAFCQFSSFVVPNGVKKLHESAFWNCNSLKTLDLPESLEEIQDGAFKGCYALTTFNLAKSNPHFKTVDDALYSKDGKTLVCVPSATNKDVWRVPDGVVSIGSHAFFCCKSLKAIEIPNSVKSIGTWAFYGCSSLKEIEIPDSVDKIGEYAFNSCTVLETIKLPVNLEEIERAAFYQCSSLKSVDLPESCREIGAFAFGGCKALTSFVVPDGVKRIERRAFVECASLKTIDVSGSVEFIERDAFDSCDAEIRAPEGSYAEQFAKEHKGERNREEARKAGYDISVDGKTFQRIVGRSGNTFSVPDGVETIAAGAFRSQGDLTKIVLPKSVAVIEGGDTFERCLKLKTFEVADDNPNFSVIDDVLFSKDGKRLVKFPGASDKRLYAVPDGVETISKGALSDCTSLQSIVIPASVRSIDVDEFEYDVSLTSVRVVEDNANYRSIDGVLFSKDGKTLIRYPSGKRDASYTIPEGATSVVGMGFSGSSELRSVVISNGVEKISGAQFLFCRSLTSIEVAKDNPNFRLIDGVLYTKDGKTLIKCPCKMECESFSVPEGVETIGKMAFGSCGPIKTIVIPDGCKKIEADAFYACSKLTAIVIPDSVESIDETALSDLSNRVEVRAHSGSYAEQVAKKLNVKFYPLD